jgi:prevent-host-death family protein
LRVRFVFAKLHAVKQVDIAEAQAQLSHLLEAVEGGERVVIARDGEPVAMLVPYVAAVRHHQLGGFTGEATLHTDFDELPADIAAAFGAAG